MRFGSLMWNVVFTSVNMRTMKWRKSAIHWLKGMSMESSENIKTNQMFFVHTNISSNSIGNA